MNAFFSTDPTKQIVKRDDMPSTSTPPKRVARLSPWMMYAIGLIILSIITLAVVWYEYVSVRV